jgi:cytochrome c peroxidase
MCLEILKSFKNSITRPSVVLLMTACLIAGIPALQAHLVPPEPFHPIAESYRRMNFMLDLNPVAWKDVASDAGTIMEGLDRVAPEAGAAYDPELKALLAPALGGGEGPVAPLDPEERKATARALHELCTVAVAETLIAELKAAESHLDSYTDASRALNEARQLWAAFEHEVRATDRDAFMEIGQTWLELSSAVGAPGVLGSGKVSADPESFKEGASKIIAYVEKNFGDGYSVVEGRPFAPLPVRSASFSPQATIPIKLPPGHNLNKQLPRPRQILNMATRGVDESETPLIAIGDMAFDSPYIFGEPARSLLISCNTCHNKSITNPQFAIPGLSTKAGGMDVSNSFFAPHANNGHFDPLDIPDLRGIRFTAPYGRNGRFSSLREFVRNVIVNEFNGPEPDPTTLDAMIAYMNEFDFLPNPALNADGTLSEEADAAARRGEEIFRRPFTGMGNRSCATCHVPSSNFVDHLQHDIGSAQGAEAASRDRSLDTPTLLSAKYTAPYFHDGRFPTLRAVNEWFNAEFELGLNESELDDLTAYVETVGDGVEAYEDTLYTLEAEMEEFSFFLSGYDFLKARDKDDLIQTTFQTVAEEIRAHKWDAQHDEMLDVLDRMAELMDEAYAASVMGDLETADAKVAEYLGLYEQHKDELI